MRKVLQILLIISIFSLAIGWGYLYASGATTVAGLRASLVPAAATDSTPTAPAPAPAAAPASSSTAPASAPASTASTSEASKQPKGNDGLHYEKTITNESGNGTQSQSQKISVTISTGSSGTTVTTN